MFLNLLLAFMLIAMLFTGIFAVIHKNLFSAVLLFGAFSYFTVLAYLILSAPDVAFTEAVIGVVSTAYFVTTLREIGNADERKRGERE